MGDIQGEKDGLLLRLREHSLAHWQGPEQQACFQIALKKEPADAGGQERV